MSQFSKPWGGTSTGDAGPYTDQVWRDIWRILFQTDDTVEGVIRNYLNELEVSGTSSPLNIATGAALVEGGVFCTDGAVSLDVDTPVSDTRQDYVVLQMDWVAQTIRIALHEGVEGGSLPSLTQVADTTWEIPLASISITTGGVITVTDVRTFAATPLASGPETKKAILSERLDPGNSRVPQSGITAAGRSAPESGGAGTVKPVWLTAEYTKGSGNTGLEWSFVARATPTAPKVEIHFYPAGGNTSANAVFNVYVARVGSGDSDVTNKVFDTVNAFTVSVPDTAGEEYVVTLDLTNFDGMQEGDAVIIAIERDEGDGSDDASGSIMYRKGRFLYE